MSVQGIRGVCRDRGQTDLKLWNAQGLSKGLVGQSRIAADKLACTIFHHLRSVDAVQAKALGIRALPLAVEAGRVRILPANVVPVVNVLAEHDHFRALYGLPIQLFEKPVCWGQLEHPSDVKSSTSTGVRTSDPASDPWRGCGVSVNIQVPIKRTTITETTGIFIVFSVLVSC